jgi:dephospho-CoA kinase
MKYNDPLIVAVTGGMGSGQSTVCSFFEEWNCMVLNADIEAKTVIQKNPALRSDLRRTFGNDIFFRNRKLNSKRLAEIAFSDELQTRKLNQLVHPRMVESIIEKMEKARFSGKYPIIIVDAALIYEISIERNFDYIVVVTAPVSIRQKRVFERDNISKNSFNDRISKQIKLEEKAKWADYVIENKGTLDELKKKSADVYSMLMKKVKTEKSRNPSRSRGGRRTTRQK